MKSSRSARIVYFILAAAALLFLFLSVIRPITAVALAGSASNSASTPPVKIPILIYHSVRPYYSSITKLVKEFTVPPDVFERQLQYLKLNGYSPIVPDDVVNYFLKNKPLPQRPVLITLDDGWENQYRYAFPVLKKYGFAAVFYVYPDAVGRKHFLTWTQIKEMSVGGMIIGDHTKSHPKLPKITDEASLREEIVASKSIIETRIGKTINSFAYPFGEYNDRDVDIVRSVYTSGRGVKNGTYQTKNDLFTLNGIIVTGDFNKFVAHLSKILPTVAPPAPALGEEEQTSPLNAPDLLQEDQNISPEILSPALPTSPPAPATTTPQPFVISGVSAANITTSGAKINWTSSVPADSLVEFGLTATYTDKKLEPTLVTSHSVSISGLNKNTIYHYHAKSKDAKGNTVASEDQTFTTPSK